MAREDTLRKVKALLSKQGAGGTTPEEVAAAVALATRLMEREGITEAEMDVNGNQEEPQEDIREFQEPLDAGKRKLASWRLRLGTTLAHAHGCYIFTRGPELRIVGRPSDAEVTRYLFAYCSREIDRLTRALCKGEGRTYANNFRIGCVEAIAASIQAERDAERTERRAAVSSNASALLVLDTAIARMDARVNAGQDFLIALRRETIPGYRMGRRAMSDGRADHGAREAGRAAGASIYPGNRKGIGASGGHLRIGSGR